MIAKGNTHDNGGKLADYLMHGGPGEHAVLFDMRGFASGDLRAEFLDIELLKEHATKADAALFHVQIRGVDGEGKKLTDAQLLEIADGCDLALGRAMTQQPRAAVLHIDDATGDRHLHLAYDLIGQSEDGRCFVEKLGLYKTKLQLYAREVEIKYGLEIVSNERRPGARRAERNEFEEGRRLGIDTHAVRTAIMQGFHAADSGKAFDAAMKERNWIVAGGDRNCFVVIDEAGGKHALNKKLTGMTLQEINARFADLDRASLPSVDQAKAMQLDRATARQASQTREQARDAITRPTAKTPSQAPENARQTPVKPLGQTAGEVRAAWQKTKGHSAAAFAQEIENRGLILVYVSRDEAAASYRAKEYARAVNRQNRVLKEGFAVVDRRGTVTRIDQRVTGDLWHEIQERLGGIDRRELLTVDQARETMKEARRAEFAEKKRAEREAARPATKLEQAIIAADHAAGRDDLKFAETLDKAGIAIARVTEQDLTALQALRADQDLSAASGETPRRFAILADVKPGELVVVTKLGDVLPLNQQRMAALENRNFPTPRGITPSHEIVRILDSAGDPKSSLPLPGIVEARAAFEIDAALLQSYWAEIARARALDREDATARRVAMFDTGQAIEARNAVADSIQDAKQGVIKAGLTAADTAVSFTGKALHSLEWAATGIISALGNIFASPMRPTELEQEIAPRVRVEADQARADAMHREDSEAEYDFRAAMQRRAQQEKDLRISSMTGTPPTAEANLNRDPDRERDRGRDV